jgi:hypothetical protein
MNPLIEIWRSIIVGDQESRVLFKTKGSEFDSRGITSPNL